MLNEKELFNLRIALLRAYLEEREYDGILLNRPDNFAMATGGKRNYVYLHADRGAFSLYVQADGRVFYVGNAIETLRATEEELAGFGCEIIEFPWFSSTPGDTVKGSFKGIIVSDDGSVGENVDGDLAYLRALLSETEIEKYRRLGAFAADAMTATLQSIGAGDSEVDIAARLVAEGNARHCLVPVSLVAADERIARYRHPIPTVTPMLGGALEEKCVNGYVMVVGCFVREGLVASVTRMKKVGDIDRAIEERYDKICAVDAIAQEATRPGRTLGDIFNDLRAAYTQFGFSETEWHNHHQGGATGYAGRTAKGTPSSTFALLTGALEARARELSGIDTAFGHAFAWNPSGPGVKSEDTFVLNPDGSTEIVTLTPALSPVDLATVLGRETAVVKSGMA